MFIKRFLLHPFAAMSIRTKLTLNAAITIGLALLVALTVLALSRSVEKAAENNRFATAVIKDVSDLDSLSYAYLLLKERRPAVQWRLKHASLEKVLSEHRAVTPEEQVALARLRANHDQMKRLFDAVSAKIEEGQKISGNASSPYDELSEGVAAQLMTRAEMMSTDASLLGAASARYTSDVRRTALVFVLLSATALVVSAALTASLLARSMGGSIRALERGTKRIASGDLEHRLDLPARDELGRLARSFDDMTERLRSVTVSKDRLEQEMEERKAVEEELRKARDELEQRVRERTAGLRRQAELLELAYEAILVRDLQNKVTFWNGRAEELYGWTKSEAIGNVTHTFLDTQFPVSFEDHMRVLAEEGRWEGELVHSTKDGRRIIVFSRQSLQRDEAGSPLAILEINLDITKEKEAKDEIKRYTSQLEASNRELQDFAFVASHDLQEPLRKIQAFGDQLRTDYHDRLDDEGRDYLERMHGAAVRMQALIQALLNYSRVTTKAKPFSLTDLASVAREVVSDLEARAKETGGAIEIGDLASIEADPTQMRQLIQNLIGNALKFHGDEKPLVRVYGRPAEDGQYSIFVGDNGIGFDEKYLDRIFTPFQRLHGRGVYEGTGIGLAICRKIADRHGGSITASSAPGKGSTFVVTLPMKQPKGGT